MNATAIMGALGDKTLMTALDNVSIANSTDVFTSPGLVIGTSSTAAVKIAATTVYKILGRMFSKTTAEIAFTATAANNIANLYEQMFLLQLDYAGNGLLIPGTPTSGPGTARYPERPTPSLLLTTQAIVLSASAQAVSVSNVTGLVVGTTVNVDNGSAAEAVAITAIDTVANTISGVFTANHPLGTEIRQGFCPIGSVRIYCGGSSTFTAATTALSASGLVVTYENGYPSPLFQVAQ